MADLGQRRSDGADRLGLARREAQREFVSLVGELPVEGTQADELIILVPKKETPPYLSRRTKPSAGSVQSAWGSPEGTLVAG